MYIIYIHVRRPHSISAGGWGLSCRSVNVGVSCVWVCACWSDGGNVHRAGSHVMAHNRDLVLVGFRPEAVCGCCMVEFWCCM